MIVQMLAAAASVASLTAAMQAPAEVEISIEGVRSARGVLHLCLTRHQQHFPDCGNDPAAIKRTVPASTRNVRIQLPSATYAVSLFHDENSDQTLNTFLGVPREGFGFSRNPRVRFGAPSFDSVRIGIVPGTSRMQIRMQYML